jgi:hypothetical protein
MFRRGLRAMAWVVLILLAGAVRADEGQPRASLAIEPAVATVGDRVQATLTVDLPPAMTLDSRTIGPALGEFSVFSGEWKEPLETEQGIRHVWTGTISAFETGEFEIPEIRLGLTGPEGALSVSSNSVPIEIVSVLESEDPAGEEVDLADLKPPASVDPNFRPLTIALIILGALLLVAVVLWWLHRRYAARLAAVAPPDDPFHRMPPHEWVYEELRQLLERRIPEQGQVDLFYSELSRILKRYLGGRYRLDLMEHTTDEIAPLLDQVGTGERPLAGVARVLGECDRVKFARDRPASEAWRAVVEAVYEIVDETKPLEVRGDSGERGVA